jgi:capsid protein
MLDFFKKMFGGKGVPNKPNTPAPPQNSLRAGNPDEGYRRRRARQESFDAMWNRSRPMDLVALCRLQAADVAQVVTNRRRKKNHVIRTGLHPLFNFTLSTGLPDSDRNKRLTKRWRKWTKRCDSRQRLSFSKLQRLAHDELFASGSFFAKKILDFSNKNVSPLRIQLLDRDHLDRQRNSTEADGSVTRRGIKYNAADQVLGYWLFDQLPNDNWLGRLSAESRYVPAEWLLHVYIPERITQREGVPEGSSAALTAGDLEDFQGYALQQAMIGATDGGKLIGGDAGDLPGLGINSVCDPNLGREMSRSCGSRWPTYFDSNGKLVGEGMTIGVSGPQITVLPKGEYKEPAPQTPNANLPQFSDHCARRIAGPSGLSYEMSTGDVSKTSFAGIMATQQLSGVDFECSQFDFIEDFLSKIMEWWLGSEWLFGGPESRRDLAGYGDDPDEYHDAVSWQYNGEQTLNPYQQATAAEKRIDLGMSCHRGEAAAIGENFDENIGQQMEELDLLIHREEKKLRLLGLKKQVEKGMEPNAS